MKRSEVLNKIEVTEEQYLSLRNTGNLVMK